MSNTIQDLKDVYKGQYAEVEIYAYGRSHKLHTDYINYIDPDMVDCAINMDLLIPDDWELMTEEDYNSTINANCDNADFEEWFGDKNAQVLVILLDWNWNKLWYAVLTDREDNDWGSGSYDLDVAIDMCRSQKADGNTDSYILIIDPDDNIIDEIEVPAHGTVDIR